jgi:hypothetical protein
MNQCPQNGGMFSSETIKEFRDVIACECGAILDDKEAAELLSGMVGYFDVLAKIDQRDDVQVS